jgi:hypothetical protein
MVDRIDADPGIADINDQEAGHATAEAARTSVRHRTVPARSIERGFAGGLNVRQRTDTSLVKPYKSLNRV